MEKHVIGGLLLGDSEAYTALDSLRQEDFYYQRHGVLFGVIRELHARDSVIDLVTVSEALKSNGRIGEAGGDEYLFEIAAEVVSAAGMDSYCSIVKEKAERRRLIADAKVVMDAAYNEGIPADEVRGIAESRLLDAEDAVSGEPVSAREALKSTLHLIERCHAGQIQGLQTQYHLFNSLTGGICAPDWIVLAGRPAVGKTALAIDIADYLATDERKQVLVFSLEMTREQLMQRIICRRQGIDFQALRTGRLPRQEFQRITDAVAELLKSNLYIDDNPDQTPASIMSRCRRHKAKHGLDLVIVDNLSIMDSDRRSEGRIQEVSAITRAFKKNAKKLELPIVTLVHLNRSIEARGEDAIPRMSDLRECGTIEQDADCVYVMHKPDPQGTRVDVHALKQRNGPSGVVIPFTSELQYMRFKTYDARDGFLGSSQA